MFTLKINVNLTFNPVFHIAIFLLCNLDFIIIIHFYLKGSTVAVSLVLSILLLCDGSGSSFTAGLLLLLVTAVNIGVTGLDGYLKHQEIFRRTDRYA